MDQANEKIANLMLEVAALRTAKGFVADKTSGLPMLAVYLVAQEHARRKREYAFVPPSATRSKKDPAGTLWRIHTTLPADEQVAEIAGYEAANPPHRDYILISAQADRGRYDLAIDELDRLEREWPQVTKTLAVVRSRMAQIIGQPLSAAKQRLSEELTTAEDEVRMMGQRHAEALAIVDSAFARLYFMKMDELDRMADYGLRVEPVSVDVPAPKRYALTLPKYLQEGARDAPQDPNDVLAQWQAETMAWGDYQVKEGGQRVKAVYDGEIQRYRVFDGRTMEKWDAKGFEERFEVAVDLPVPA